MGGGGSDKHDENSPYVPLSPAECRKAVKYAVRVVNELKSYSKLEDTPGAVPLLSKDEVVLGDLLGSGGFNHVYEVATLDWKDDPERSKAQEAARKHLWKSQSSKEVLLAVKFLNSHAMSHSEEYCNGAADLLLEARYLRILAGYPHPNIIRLHGMAAAGPQGFATGVEGGFFLILDRLYDTLDRRLDVWRELVRRKRTNDTHDPDVKLHLKALFLLQMQVGIDLASALSHLHKLRIIFRDLKPDNVGFDYRGVIKLFDFGLAKELDPKQQKTDRSYNMSGATGSRRYMAPEVSLSKSYHLSADVYSFGILLWEVLTFEKAYWDMSIEEHHSEVIVAGTARPKIPQPIFWPAGIIKLLRECWATDLNSRPLMREVTRSLQRELSSFSRECGLSIPPDIHGPESS